MRRCFRILTPSPRVGVAILLFTLICVGCAHQKPLLGGGYEIDDVELEGVTRFSKSELLAHLFAGETSWVPFTPDQPFDEALVAVDKKRLEALYRSYGYRQAVVMRFEPTVDHDDEEVDLFIAVDEGTPTLVRSVHIQWFDGTVDATVQARVAEASSVSVDTPIEVVRINRTIGALRQALLQESYPLARVTGAATIDEPGRRADVTFEVHPGPRATIGSVRFVGLEEVPRYLVDNEVEFALGEPWTPARVRQMEDAVKAMRVFRWVAAEPPSAVDDGKAEVLIRVSEADPQSIRIGVQLGLETTRWQEQVRVDYTHTNLFGHLTRLDLVTLVGWAELPNPWDPFQHGPVVTFEPQLTKKGLLEKHLLWSLVPGIDVDIQEGYQYYAPRNRLAVNRWFLGMLKLGLAHDIRFVDFFNVSAQLDRNESILGRDFRDPFILSKLEASAELYLTDSIVEPENGVILDGTYAISGFFLGSDYDFHQVEGGLRAYYRPVERVQLAAQARTGIIIPYGSEGASPFSHRLYLGGSNDVRGWGSRRLAPRLEECDGDGECESIPIGGQTMLHATLELRVRVFWKLWLVAFGDMGDVQSDALTWKVDEWNYTAGGGVRVDTPLGRVRLDFGWRLNDPGIYDEPRWALHFGLGEAF